MGKRIREHLEPSSLLTEHRSAARPGQRRTHAGQRARHRSGRIGRSISRAVSTRRACGERGGFGAPRAPGTPGALPARRPPHVVAQDGAPQLVGRVGQLPRRRRSLSSSLRVGRVGEGGRGGEEDGEGRCGGDGGRRGGGARAAPGKGGGGVLVGGWPAAPSARLGGDGGDEEGRPAWRLGRPAARPRSAGRRLRVKRTRTPRRE